MTTDGPAPARRAGARRRRVLMLVAAAVVLASAGPCVGRRTTARPAPQEPAGPVATVAQPARTPEGLEVQFLAALNTRRRRLGLPPLASDPRMVTVARDWANRMAAEGHISHNQDLAAHMPDDWRKYGENVGVGDTVASLHEAFLASPHHYVNVADPEFNAVGIGVVLQGRIIWVVFDFLASPSAPEATPATTALPS